MANTRVGSLKSGIGTVGGSGLGGSGARGRSSGIRIKTSNRTSKDMASDKLSRAVKDAQAAGRKARMSKKPKKKKSRLGAALDSFKDAAAANTFGLGPHGKRK